MTFFSLRRICSFALTTLCLVLSASVTQAASDKDKPNIVLIYADDMGYGDMACQNPDSKIPTPHLDQLASEGARFIDGHSSSGICTPSRYALLTGRYHWRAFHGITASCIHTRESRFEPERLTLPEMLSEAGYRTGAVGKWHLGWGWPAVFKPHVKGRQKAVRPEDVDWSLPIPDGPLDHGFDYYFGGDGLSLGCWIENNRVTEVPTLFNEDKASPMCEGWDRYQALPTMAKKSVAWIKQQEAGKPFFLYFSLVSPHAPILPTEEFAGTTDAGAYGDYMHQTDHVVGQVLEALDEAGFRDNTLVIFSSDNGPETSFYGRLEQYAHDSAGGLRGGKRDIWEGGHRVPFLVRWPGVIEPGRVSPALINQVDLMATFAALVGYNLPNDAAEDSFNQLPAWKDNSDQTIVRTAMVHNTKEGDHYAIRQGDWVLVDHPTGIGSGDRLMGRLRERYGEGAVMPNGGLFNLKEDLGQIQNQIDVFPEKATQLRALLEKIRKGSGSAPRLQQDSSDL